MSLQMRDSFEGYTIKKCSAQTTAGLGIWCDSLICFPTWQLLHENPPSSLSWVNGILLKGHKMALKTCLLPGPRRWWKWREGVTKGREVGVPEARPCEGWLLWSLGHKGRWGQTLQHKHWVPSPGFRAPSHAHRAWTAPQRPRVSGSEGKLPFSIPGFLPRPFYLLDFLGLTDWGTVRFHNHGWVPSKKQLPSLTFIKSISKSEFSRAHVNAHRTQNYPDFIKCWID